MPQLPWILPRPVPVKSQMAWTRGAHWSVMLSTGEVESTLCQVGDCIFWVSRRTPKLSVSTLAIVQLSWM